ncbi:MAG: SEC-C domain-containing protein [Rhodocyclaceae bacterium]|nr:SEC-C domain-containing protein [Rhodocyclaceae bacterium]
MTTNSPPDDPPAIDGVLRLGVQEILAAGDFQTAFQSFLSELPLRCPEFTAKIPPGAERPLGLLLFREIWNHTPRPDLGWQRQSLPKPERNGPCPCGSGDKYKQCCGGPRAPDPFPSEGLSVLGYVLETVPVTRYATLPFAQLDPEELAHVANQWQDEGRIEAATLLLEGLLAPDRRLGRHHEWAFDTLCNLYLDAGRDDDRLALVERLTKVSDKRLKAAALQRRATLHADCGEYHEAWAVFGAAMRLDPDNPALAHLELVMLANEDRYDEAQNRAAVWAKRLARSGRADDALVELIEEVARDAGVLRDMMADDEAGQPTQASPADVAMLQALIEQLPAPASHYRLAPDGDSAGPLEPMAALGTLERAWADLDWGDPLQSDPWQDTRWLHWLSDHPLAWQSFEVLDAVAGAFDGVLLLEYSDEQADAMEDALLTHAVGVLREVLAANRAEGLRFEWGWLANRAALRVLMQRIELAGGSADELPLLEWLVLTLDPQDNGGHRERLVHAYCEAGRAADALAVCDRYPGDTLPGVLYGRVLALFLLGRRGDAVAALAHAVKRLPKVLKMLLAARPKAPTITPGQITRSGDDQAWEYRIDFRSTWISCDALGWLKEISGRKT